MKSIADDFALVQSPISEEDLFISVITQLGDDFHPILAAIRVRTTPITFTELHDILTDYQRSLKHSADQQLLLATTNAAQKQSPLGRSPTSTGQSRDQNVSYRKNRGGSSRLGNNSAYRQGRFCNFCEISGHDIKFCRKLATLLRENNLQLNDSQPSRNHSPMANMATSSPIATSQWMFDTRASHHATSNTSTLHGFTDYGGLDEISPDDANTLIISHIGHTTLPTSIRSLSLNDVLCVPKLQTDLVSVSKLCKSNQVSVEFFPTYFLVKDLARGCRFCGGRTSMTCTMLQSFQNHKLNSIIALATRQMTHSKSYQNVTS